MTVKRRDFLRTVGIGTVAASVGFRETGDAAQTDAPGEQKLHRDSQSRLPGVEYYFIGNGRIQLAVQSSPSQDEGTHGGLLLMSPEHFGRKTSSFLYHPERGLERSRCTIVAGGKGYEPQHAKATIARIYPDGIPTITIDWEAGSFRVHEEFFCPAQEAAFIRTVSLTNAGTDGSEATGIVYLYPNLMFFDEYASDRASGTLTANGYHRLQLFSPDTVTAGDRDLRIAFGSVPPGGTKKATFILTMDLPREEFNRRALEDIRLEAARYWTDRTTLDAGDNGLNHLFNSSKTGIRMAVADSGKMDGGIWQYNMEWVRDQSMVATAAVMLGQNDVAESMLNRMISRSVSESGSPVEASRHRPLETVEIDQNGELMSALWTHWMWTGNDAIIRQHWKKIGALADFVLQPFFRDPAIGLLKNSREFWERDTAFGVREGYELTYQLWNILGLTMAADMADHLNEKEKARRWRDASSLMKTSFLNHPKFSLVSDGHFIKRRLATGGVQTTFEPPNRKSMPPGMPLQVEKISYCDPDSADVLPIALGLVDPSSELSLNTLRFIETLWNQRWNIGGYGRYDVTSEPDSPGPWPFATMFITRAYLEAGNHEMTWRALRWMLNVQGGKGGAWFEFNGDRPTPPLPPVGIVIWTWAEIVMCFMHNLFGIRPTPQSLRIRPRLLQGVDGIMTRFPLRGKQLTLKVRRTATKQAAMLNGKPVAISDGGIAIPYPAADAEIELHV